MPVPGKCSARCLPFTRTWPALTQPSAHSTVNSMHPMANSTPDSLLSIPRVRTPPSLPRVSPALSSIRNLFRQSVSIFSRNILPLICCDLFHIFGSKYLEANDTQKQTHIYFGVSGTTTAAEDSILCGPFLSWTISQGRILMNSKFWYIIFNSCSYNGKVYNRDMKSKREVLNASLRTHRVPVFAW